MLRIGLCAVTLLALLAWTDAACSVDQVAHCDSCSNPGVECIRCPSGSIINVDKTACDSCPDNCGECDRLSDSTLICLDCYNRYALRDSDGVCLECVSGCGLCHHTSVDETDCDECYESWVSVITGELNTCLECPSNCFACNEADDGSAVCTQCDNYYFLKTADKSCKRCPTNCETCTDDGNGKGSCSKCKDGYKVNDEDPTKSCLNCPSACKSCTNVARTGNTAVCDDCHLAFALDNDECIFCDVNCVECETSTSCSVCQTGYRVDSGSCVSCSDHCKVCSIEDGSEVCDECFASWVPKDEVSCDECGTRCNVCNLNGDCTTCESLYEVDDNGKCQKCPSKCLDCTYSTSNSKTWCRSGLCETGYTVDGNGDCAACPSSCNDNACSWSSSLVATICSSCNDTYQTHTLDNTKENCLDCPSDCADCSYNATGFGRVICDDCDSYFEVLDEQCSACPDSCDTCTYNSTITAMDCNGVVNCDTGYRFGEDEGGDGNDICISCGVADCHRCNDTDACITCISPFQLRTDGQECRACPDHCTQCSWDNTETDTECDSDTYCDAYYGLSTDSLCPSCRSHCQKCPQDNSGDNECRSGWCDSEYTVDTDGNCKSCPGKCSSCTYHTGDKRTKCQSNSCYNRYALISSEPSDGNCASCPDNCAECSWEDDGEEARTWCTLCDSGFDLRSADGTCEPCPDNCWVCTYNEDTDATECDSNEDCYSCYGITPEFNCDECPYDCEDCTYNEELAIMQCDDCKTHFVDNDGVCGACPSHCTTCSDNSGSIDCTVCDARYALYQGECLSCPSNCLECTANGNGVTQCKEGMCRTGYGRNSKKTCSTCSSMFENCNRCSDTTGFNVDGADIADCYSCNGGWTLADDALSCKETFAGTCSEFEDRNYVCSGGSCQAGFTEMSNGSCSTTCYTCGSTRNNVLLSREECHDNWVANANASQEICVNDCWVIAEKYQGAWTVARGCHLPDQDLEEGITCADNDGSEGSISSNCKNVERNGVEVKRCWRCCGTELCNASPAIQACFGLLAATMAASILSLLV